MRTLIALLFCPFIISCEHLPSAPTVSAAGFPSGFLTFSTDDGRACIVRTAIPMLDSVGLKSTDYIITGKLGDPNDYMTREDVLSLEARGHEIGNHTRTHPELLQISESAWESEIVGGRQDLLSIGVRVVETFAYPYGHYNSATEALVARSGHIAARSTRFGENTPIEDKYALKHQNMGGSVTIGDVRGWIDEAQRNHLWLILLFHHVDRNPGDYSVTPELFGDTVNYARSSGIKVITVREGARMMR